MTPRRQVGQFPRSCKRSRKTFPIDPSSATPSWERLAPIRVVNSLFSSGDGNRGVADRRVQPPERRKIVKEMGSKSTMLKNVQELKFKRSAADRQRRAGAPDQKNVSFDAFFTHILMHELMHGLGPHEVPQAARKSPCARSFKILQRPGRGQGRHQRAVRHAAADRQGRARQVVRADDVHHVLAGSFRSIRFASRRRTARRALQINWLLDKALQVAPDGTFSVDAAKVKEESPA